MKKLINTFLFFLAVFALSAQDLIYTVSGEINDQKTSLDSILVENLSNDTRILFDNLPALEYYQINLSKNAFWGSVGASDTEIKPEFIETRNLPGLIQLAYRGISPVEARLSVFNINGQLVYTTKRKTMFPGNSIQVQLAATGVYFVQIQSPLGTKTFKAIGSENQSDYGVKITGETTAGVNFKSSFLTLASDFSFMEGDSLRISVYKEEYYARPSSFSVITSRYVNFEFRVSSVVETGVSDAYVALDEITTNVTAYDTLSGQVILEYSGEKPELKPGDIITVDVDSMGYLRKVVETIDEDGVITVETVQAYLNEVFIDMEIKLHTALIEPSTQLKKGSTASEISKALTDENGYIHPVKVISLDDKGNISTKSAFTNDGPIVGREPIINEYNDLSNIDLYGKKGDSKHLYIHEGHLFLKVDAVYEMNFKYSGELEEDTKIKKGDLTSFLFYLDGEAEAMAKMQLNMNSAFKKENNTKMFNIIKKVLVFNVMGVPVWITLNSDLYSEYSVNVDAALDADWGFKSNHKLEVGGIYKRESNSFSPRYFYKDINEVYPLNIEGEINADARLEIYPRTETRFYGFFGPFTEIVPYAQGNYNAALQSQITGEGAETFLAWNSGINLGLDFRVGTQLKFLGIFNKSYGPTVVPCFYRTLWQTPVNLELLTELPEQVEGGNTLPLNFKVTDLWGLPVSLCPVYIEGDGTFSKQILITNANGEVTVNWTLPSSSGNAEFMTTIYRANGSVIQQINRWVQVSGSAPSVTTLAASVITETSARLNGEVISDGGSPITQRGFYWCKDCDEPDEENYINTVTGTIGKFSHQLTGLQPKTRYAFKAFATNSIGTGTGNVFYLATDAESVSVPTVSTTAVTEITQTTATSGGNVTSDGGAPVTARGICWSTFPSPTTDDNKTTDGSGKGGFTSYLTGLTPATTYYIRAYATNSEGTAYGEPETFKAKADEATSGIFTDLRDGNTYKWVKIGEQVWMKENLKYLPALVGPGTRSTSIPLYYVFDYDGTDVSIAKTTDFYQIYGVLYNWPAAMDGASKSDSNPSGVQGACPAGWHLPSASEWTQLINFLELQGYPNSNIVGGAGNVLKVARQDGHPWGGEYDTSDHPRWNAHKTHYGIDEFDFSALPGSSLGTYNYFYLNNLGRYGYWWSSSTPSNNNLPLNYNIQYGRGDVNRSSISKRYAYSVRCIKD